MIKNSLVYCSFLAVLVILVPGPASARDVSRDAQLTGNANHAFLETTTGPGSGGITVRTGADYFYTSAPQKIDVDLQTQATAPLWQAGDPSWEVPRQRGTPAISNPNPVNPVSDTVDSLLARQNSAGVVAASSFAIPIHNFDAIRSGANPNDPNGEVGVHWFVVAINGAGGSQYMFYDKADPTVTAGPYTLSTLGSGPCSGGHGDPVILFDEMAQRWVFTEFSSSGNRLCVYVSQTSDPISGGFFAYDFQAPDFPDYPKYAVWADAYYVGTNESSSAVYALDRLAMLAGAPATMQRFTVAKPAAFGFAVLPPVDHDGYNTPPIGAPGTFIRHFDDEAHTPGSNVPTEDYLELFEFAVDFATPGNSTLTGPIRIAISEIDSHLCGFTSYECFPQQGSPIGLDPLREVVMNLPKYRNFGSHESIVGNLTTDVDGSDHGGVRWFELRRTNGGNWALYQEGTWAPDGNHRFMAASAIDESGNIALGYSISGSSLFPGVRYTGRLESSPLGVLSEPEVTLASGTSAGNGNRWGDYASMSVDPADGCTFWLVENYAVAGATTRQNRVGAFRFEDCGESTFTLDGNPLQQHFCSIDGALQDVELKITGRSGFDNLVSLDFSSLPAGIAGTFNPALVAPDGVSTVSFLLDPVTVSPGINAIIMRGTADQEDLSGIIARELVLSAFIATAVPGPATLVAPLNGAKGQSTTPAFSWTAGSQWDGSTLEIATDPAFTNVVYSITVNNISHTISEPLELSTAYYWRVHSSNDCGTGTESAVHRFVTRDAPVEVCVTPNLPITDNDPAGVSSDILLNLPGQVLLDLDIRVKIDHTWISDLQVRLEQVDSGTSVLLFDRHCGSANNMDVLLDDSASKPVSDCPGGNPAVSGTRRPDYPLANFNGLPVNGPWRLTVVDNGAQDTGTLVQWCVLYTPVLSDEVLFIDGFEQP